MVVQEPDMPSIWKLVNTLCRRHLQFTLYTIGLQPNDYGTLKLKRDEIQNLSKCKQEE